MSAKPLNFAQVLDKRCVEPNKRMCAGRYGWVTHRFPIKGGLPLRAIWQATMRESLARPSFFTERLLASAVFDRAP